MAVPKLHFLSEFGVDFYEISDTYCGDAAYHCPDKEILIAYCFLDPAGCHSRQHHAESHEAGADTVVGRAVSSFGKIYKIEHIGGETESIAELFDKHADVHYCK